MTDPYVEAALFKVEVAESSLDALREIREGSERERLRVQTHYEALLGAGVSAGDQLAEAIARELGISIFNNSPDKLLRVLDSSDAPPLDELGTCIERFRTWNAEPIARDAHERRRLAVHHHYGKHPATGEGTWFLEPIEIRRERSPYDGPFDIHSYGEAYVETLRALVEVARCVESAIVKRRERGALRERPR
jgi:hypothetical protein